MEFNRFSLNIVVRSIVLALNALILALFATKTDWFFTAIFLSLLLILQIILLIRYASKTNRNLANFLIHLKEQDTTLAFSRDNLDKTFKGISHEFERINKEFKKIKKEKIKKQHLLNLLLDKVGTGIVAINAQHEIELYNQAILNLFGIEEYTPEKLKNGLFKILNECRALHVGGQSIINTQVNNIIRRVLVALTELKEDNEVLKIYSFHDIDREITGYELQSWNGLIKVLSHEIMNTLTPMSTVVGTLKDCLTLSNKEKLITQLKEKDLQDSVKGISLLENRISNLKDFIAKFRQFSDIPVPELKQIDVKILLNQISEIHKYDTTKIKVNSIPTPLVILGDQHLIELILSNIIKNAYEASASQICLNAFASNKQTIIEVQDNASGIEPSLIKKVFLPFYTTKKDGSGIGLPLARQIMFAHGGNIEIESSLEGTCVKLIFKDN